MKTVTMVAFDDKYGERMLIADAVTHINIAFPDYKLLPDDAPERRIVRALNACAGGDAVSAETLDRAAQGLEVLIDQCARESSVGYWLEAEPDIAAVPPNHPMHGIGNVLAEARRGQETIARRALDIIAAARGPKMRTDIGLAKAERVKALRDWAETCAPHAAALLEWAAREIVCQPDATVVVNDCVVSLVVETDGSGAECVRLTVVGEHGEPAKLEGEEPGIYYPSVVSA